MKILKIKNKNNIYIQLLFLFFTLTLYSQSKTDTVVRFYDNENKVFLEKNKLTSFYYVDSWGKRMIVDTLIISTKSQNFIHEYLNEGLINWNLSNSICDSLCHFYCFLLEKEGECKEVRIIDIREHYPYYPCTKLNLFLSTQHDFTFEKTKAFFLEKNRNKKYPILVFVLRSCSQ